MTAVCSLPGEQGIHECSSSETWLWGKCCSDKSSWFDRSSAAAVEEISGTTSSTGRGNWDEGAETMLDVSSSIAKCFLVPVWWGSSSSGIGGGTKQHDGVQKHLVLSHGVNGPSARIVLWKNYMGFDCRGARRNLGTLIRAYNPKKKISENEEVEKENQSFLGSMLGTALSKFVNSQMTEVIVQGCFNQTLVGSVEMQCNGWTDEAISVWFCTFYSSIIAASWTCASQVPRTGSCIVRRRSFGKINSDHSGKEKGFAGSIACQGPHHHMRKRLESQVSCNLDGAASSSSPTFNYCSLVSPLLADYLKDLLPEGLRGERLAGVQVGMKNGVVHLTEGKEMELGQNSNYNGKLPSPSVALSFGILNGGRTVLINREGECEWRVNGISFDVGSETSIGKLGVIDSKLVIGGDFYITPS